MACDMHLVSLLQRRQWQAELEAERKRHEQQRQEERAQWETELKVGKGQAGPFSRTFLFDEEELPACLTNVSFLHPFVGTASAGE